MVITKELRFEAAHTLPKHKNPDGTPGKCSRLHGHSYRLEVAVEGPINPETGMVIDFALLKKILTEEVHDLLDHRMINEVFIALNWAGETTAENICRWVWHQVAKKLPEGIFMRRVRLWETENYSAELIYYDSDTPVAEGPIEGDPNEGL